MGVQLLATLQIVSLFAVIQITVCSSDVTGTIQHRLKRNTTDNNQVILRIAQPPHRQIKCIYPEVPCADSRRCYHSIYERCNGEEDCYDGSDEFGCRTPENEIDEQKERPPRRKDNFPELFRKLVIGVMVILVLLGVLACVCHFQKYTMRAVSWDSDSLDSVSSFSAQPEPQDTTGGNAICLTDFSFQKPAEELSTMTTLDPFPPSEVSGATGGSSFMMQSPQTSTSALECVSWAEIHPPPPGSSGATGGVSGASGGGGGGATASNTLSPTSALGQQRVDTWGVLQPTVLPSSPPALPVVPPRPSTSPVIISSTSDLPTYEEVMTRRRRGDAEL
ncbi:uncharacterized protein LOC115211044 [Octopus sinensis]|uniref:Uncharacterized protein LOC115211044 n=1 Tax=Octopus sinensis TaxID=2607531 RepID=A0A6P7SBM1_9MOLL|nr:uncharacterized protein LOC115211044 [Octopus sinensis]